MKKNLFILAAASTFALGFTSCSKADCIECSGGGFTTTTKYCEEDFPEDQIGMTWKQWSDAYATSPYCKKVKK